MSRPDVELNSLPIILRIYCIAAILVLAWYGFSVTRDVGRMRGNAAVLQEQIATLSAKEITAEAKYADLEGKQRRERQTYSGQEAVLASVAVMDAKAEYEKLHLEHESAMAEHTALVTGAATLQLRLVPVLAIALLHLFGFFMIRTENDNNELIRR